MSTEDFLKVERKSNIFEHIFYEFDMYYRTYVELKGINDNSSEWTEYRQFLINVFLESHLTHLRNLLNFFRGKDSINDNTALVKKCELGIHNAQKYVSIISNVLSHLDVKRVETSRGDDNLTQKIAELMKNMFPIVCNRIKKYMQLLSDECCINEDYLSQFKTPTIQKMYKELLMQFNGNGLTDYFENFSGTSSCRRHDVVRIGSSYVAIHDLNEVKGEN